MKRFIATLAATVLLMASAISCRAQKEFSDLAEIDGVTSIYIGKAMLKMAGSMAGNYTGSNDMDLSQAIKDLTSVEVLTTERLSAVKKLAPMLDKKLKSMNAEQLMEVNEDREQVVIYAQPYPGDSTLCSSLLIVTREPNEMNIVMLKGKIDPAKIAQEAAND